MSIKKIGIIAFIFLIVAAVLLLLSKMKPDEYGQLREDTRTFGTLTVTAHTSMEYWNDSLAYSDEEYCKFILEQPYTDPKITVANSKDGSEVTYLLKSRHGLSRITLNGDFTDPTNNYSTIGILFRDFSSGCNRRDQIGKLVITSDGKIQSIKFPEGPRENVVSLINTDNKSTQNVFFASPDTQFWSSDYNADTFSEYLVLVPDETNSITTAYMIDIISNKPAPWFNKGFPVKTDKRIEDITKFNPQRDFVLGYVDMEELNKNSLFRNTQQMLGR